MGDSKIAVWRRFSVAGIVLGMQEHTTCGWLCLVCMLYRNKQGLLRRQKQQSFYRPELLCVHDMVVGCRQASQDATTASFLTDKWSSAQLHRKVRVVLTCVETVHILPAAFFVTTTKQPCYIVHQSHRMGAHVVHRECAIYGST